MQNKLVALVTGANQGIGLQIASELAARNFTVMVGSRDLQKGEAAAGTLAAYHTLLTPVRDGRQVA